MRIIISVKPKTKISYVSYTGILYIITPTDSQQHINTIENFEICFPAAEYISTYVKDLCDYHMESSFN